MEYNIDGEMFPCLEVTLANGEQLYTQSGAMAWMERDIHMSTDMKGGLMKGLARMFSGNSLFLVTFTAQRDQAKMGFASTFIGTILPHEFHGETLIVQKSGFLCAQPSVQVETAFTKRVSAGLFGGEGFILQKVFGEGMCFLEASGRVIERVLAPGEQILVDTGNLLAFEESITYEVETVKGFKNIFFGGEGLFLTRLTGPGKIYLQTITAQDIATRLIPYLPSSSS
ncbi:TIGR00266 family protein [Christensenellaceae bacterium OttesenSCG-928-K19]|nr:TIGR00266 family protein [Christensenellaceae bacterium OttesenSCG-928-K19]